MLVINQLGDHQMKTYFKSTDDDNGGMICAGEVGMDDEFDTIINKIHRKSFEDVGGKYDPGENEKICAIRLPPNIFFEVISGFRIGSGLLVLRTLGLAP